MAVRVMAMAKVMAVSYPGRLALALIHINPAGEEPGMFCHGAEGGCGARNAGPRFEILLSREESVRANGGDAFEEVCERREARGRGRARGPLVVERAISEEGELRAVIREAIDLAVI